MTRLENTSILVLTWKTNHQIYMNIYFYNLKHDKSFMAALAIKLLSFNTYALIIANLSTRAKFQEKSI